MAGFALAFALLGLSKVNLDDEVGIQQQLQLDRYVAHRWTSMQA